MVCSLTSNMKTLLETLRVQISQSEEISEVDLVAMLSLNLELNPSLVGKILTNKAFDIGLELVVTKAVNCRFPELPLLDEEWPRKVERAIFRKIWSVYLVT